MEWFPKAAASQRPGNVRILRGYSSTGEQNRGLCVPPAHLLSLALLWPLSDLVHCIHAVEHSKQEGLWAMTQYCTHCKKRGGISWFSLMGSVKKYKRDVVWCFSPLLWNSWHSCLLSVSVFVCLFNFSCVILSLEKKKKKKLVKFNHLKYVFKGPFQNNLISERSELSTCLGNGLQYGSGQMIA